MSCKICGRSNCTLSFHSIEEQEDFNEVAEKVIDHIRDRLLREIRSVDGEWFYWNGDDQYFIYYDEVMKIIEAI